MPRNKYFIEKPSFESDDDNHGYWVCTKRAVISHPLLHQNLIFEVGEKTNFASIPSLFRFAFPVNDGHEDESAGHDKLYGLKGVMPWGQKLTRRQCDVIYKDWLKAGSISLWKRKVMFRGLRLAMWRSIGWNDAS